MLETMLVGLTKLPTGYIEERRIACCAAMLSSVMSLAAMVETTAVQSVQVSAEASTRRAEVKTKTFIIILVQYIIKGRVDTFMMRIGSLRSTSKYI